jgi:hypothetical protein
MELSNLEEHKQEAERSLKPEHEAGPDAEPDVEQQRVEAQKEQSKHPEPEEPDAREGAATNPGGAGF